MKSEKVTRPEKTHQELESAGGPEHSVEWFRDPVRNLGYRTPFELIAEGRWKQAGSNLCEEIGVPKAVLAAGVSVGPVVSPRDMTTKLALPRHVEHFAYLGTEDPAWLDRVLLFPKAGYNAPTPRASSEEMR